jgi:hypothetical protein
VATALWVDERREFRSRFTRLRPTVRNGGALHADRAYDCACVDHQPDVVGGNLALSVWRQ